MARHGQCRCGTILTFRKGPEGYKTRCPSCASVVRLRTEGKRPPNKVRGRRPMVAVTEVVEPSEERRAAHGSSVGGPAVPPPADFSDLETRPMLAAEPMVELEPWPGSAPVSPSAALQPRRRQTGWIVAALALAGAGIGLIIWWCVS